MFHKNGFFELCTIAQCLQSFRLLHGRFPTTIAAVKLFLRIARMMEKRKTDLSAKMRFRSGRFFKNNGKWFFNTREGTMEGPFEELTEAENRLNEYIKIMNSGFMPRHSTLQLEPLETEE
jgi:hypothetical protein